MRIGIPKPAQFGGYHADVMRAFHDALDVFRTLGAHVLELDLPSTSDVIDDVQQYHEPFLAASADRYGLGFSTAPADLPLGLQIAARPFDEEAIYAAAQAFESATGWHARRPPLA